MACQICGADREQVVAVPYPFFAHLDYSTMRDGGRIARCQQCQFLRQIVDAADEEGIRALFASRAYAESQQTAQTFIVDGYQDPVTRSFLQAQLLADHVQARAPRVLDIGCHDGELLRELDRRLPDADLHGLEVSQALHALFPRGPRFHWWDDLDAIGGTFDLVTLSHAHMYVRDIRYLLTRVRALLRDDGLLLIQGPDIASSPCHVLLGDQYHYYTGPILVNVLRRCGFEPRRWTLPWFPRELVCLARPRLGAAVDSDDQSDHQVFECLRVLNDRKSALARYDRPVGVLGTTVNAAFADSVLGERVLHFYDENPRRVGTQFRGKPVLHPRSLSDGDLLVMPYGRSGEDMCRRFAAQYAGEHAIV